MIPDGADGRYRALFNVIPQGIIVYNADGLMVEANEAAARIIGADLDRLIGHDTRRANWPAWDADGAPLPWDKRPLAITLRAGEPVRDFVFQVDRVEDGRRCWIETNTEPIFNDDGKVVAAVASISDITEQRAEQRQLQESREHLAAIIDASPPGIMTVDLDGNVTSWSPSCERIFGWTEQEVLGRFNPTLPDDMRDFYAETIVNLDDRPGGTGREIDVLCKGGSRIPISISVAPLHADGKQVGALGVMEDISARRRAEKQQLEKQQHLSAVLQSSPLPIVTVDLEGCVLSWNQAAENLFGWTADEVIGEYNPVLIEERAESFRELLDEIASNGDTQIVRTHSRRRDGSVVPVEVSAAPLRDADGNVCGVVGVHFDVSARMDAQRREREQRARLEAILGSSPFAIISVDLDGRVISWNPAAEKLFGWSEEEATGRLNPAVLPEKRGLLASILADLSDGGKLRTQDTFTMHRDGSRIPVQVSIAPLYDASGDVCGAVGIHQDIRELRKTEERLRESRARYRSLFENSPVGIWELDLSGCGSTLEMIGAESVQEYAEAFERRPDLLKECIDAIRVKDVNQAVLAMHRVESVDELRTEYGRLIGDQTAEAIGQGIALLFTGWTVFDLTLPLLAFDDEKLQLLARVQVAPGYEERLDRVLVSALDISDLEEAREDLQQSNRLLEATLGSMEEAVVVVDPHSRVMSCNEATVRAFGYSADEIVGQTTRRFYCSAEDFEKCARHAKPKLARGETHRTEMTLVRADGGEFLAEIITSPLDRSKGWLGGVVSVIRDVTESRALQERWAQSRRLEAVGQLAGGVAHDFNNMLTVIVGNLGMALRNVDDTEAVHEQVSQSLEAARRTAKLTNQLLAFSRKQVLAPEILDLDHAVEGIERLLSRTIPESIDLQADLRAGAPVYFDPAQIDQIVMNLVVNARDAMPDGGVLTIATEGVAVTDAEAVPAELSRGEYVRLSVSDTGTGMDEETQAHIFEPFFSTKDEGSGTGLGLATVYGIARQGGGGVAVSSTPGEGTRFDVYLPVAEGAPPEAVSAEQRATTAVTGETILVAEDDAAVRRLVVSVLHGRGYDVLAACSGADARRVFADHEGEIELLVTDVVMPGMSGAELARRLRAQRSDLPVLYISGYTGDVIDNHGLDEEGARLLSKPFGPDDLLREVKWVLERGKG